MKKILLLLVSFVTVWSAFGQNVPSYLEAEELPDAVIFLPPPPEEGSAHFELDQAMYEWGKTQREGDRGLQAIAEGTVNVDTMALMFSKAFGLKLSQETTPKTMHLLSRSIRTFRLSAARPKAHYNRLRPFVFHQESTLMPKWEEYERTSGSYPSGHTVRGWGMALVLAQLNPEKQDELLLAGYEWGQSRVIAGYHWQSDVNASRLLASACFARMQACKEYLEDVEEAREELKELWEKKEE